MMLLSYIVVFMTIVMYTSSAPLNTTWPTPGKPKARFLPKIAPGVYTSDQIEQIEQAHLDAIMLASNVVASTQWPNSFGQIFKPYFNMPDAVGVLGEFQDWSPFCSSY